MLSPTLAFAVSNENFDKTDVLSDLESNEGFDITNYPYDEKKEIQVINFVEYCYSYKVNLRGNYGLYVYIYNPKGLNLATSDKQNKLQIATKYDSNGTAIDYAKYNLEFLSKSEDKYANLFYKFKVIDKEIEGKKIVDRVNSNKRRYDISGIELTTYGSSKATEYPVNSTYTYEGFAEGYGVDVNDKSTLTSKVEKLETIQLDVNHTYYRTKTSKKGAGYQNQMNTAYFSLSKRFFEEYGKLQKIKAEWYEYKTKDIIVTSNQTIYDKVYKNLGMQTGKLDQFGMTEYNQNIGISLGQEAGDYAGIYRAKWGWNLGSGYLHTPATSLQYIFKVNDISSYDPLADVKEVGGVESNALYEYILSYDKSFNKERLPIKSGNISADLFESDIDEYRKLNTEYGKIQQGYSYYDFDSDVDLQTLSSWQETDSSFWDNWVNWGLWNAMTGNIPTEESRTVSPIYVLKQSDLEGTDQEISSKLLINKGDVPKIKDYYKKEVEEGKVPVLFRFATSDYYSAPVDIIELGKGTLGKDKHTSGQVYRATESVFLDFDVIQLSFTKNGVNKIIPVVSSPIDVVSDITPPINMPSGIERWQIILAVLLLILLVVILWPILPLILRLIFSIIELPFKILSKLFNHKKN